MAMMAEVCENVSIPAFKYVAEDVPVFREVGKSTAYHSEVSPLISYTMKFRLTEVGGAAL